MQRAVITVYSIPSLIRLSVRYSAMPRGLKNRNNPKLAARVKWTAYYYIRNAFVRGKPVLKYIADG